MLQLVNLREIFAIMQKGKAMVTEHISKWLQSQMRLVRILCIRINAYLIGRLMSEAMTRQVKSGICILN